MKKYLFCFLPLICWGTLNVVSAQSTVLSPMAFTPPSLTNEAIMAIASPMEGSIVFDNTFKLLRMYNGTKWTSVTVQKTNSPTMMARKATEGYYFSDYTYLWAPYIAVDNEKNVYVTGYITSKEPDAYNFFEGDIFVAKYNSSGMPLWVRLMEGHSHELGCSIALDPSGNVYVTGVFTGTISGLGLTSTGEEDIFVAKFDSSGSLKWARKAGGTSYDFGYGITVDTEGNAYVTGSLGNRLFISKYTSNGLQQWIVNATGTDFSSGYGIAADATGNVYVTGAFRGTSFFSGTTFLSSAGESDIFVAKYNNTGQLQWAQKAGGAGSDAGTGIAVEANGNAYLTGYFSGQATFATTAITSGGAFAAKYTANGTFQWVQKSGGWGNSIALDAAANVYLAGRFSTKTGALSTQSTSIFVIKYNSNGVMQWESGGIKKNANDGVEGISIVIDASNTVYVAGDFENVVRFGGSVLFGQEKDVFVARIVD